MTSFFCVVFIACYFIHCYEAIFLHDGFNCCNALWCHYSVCLTGVEESLLQNWCRSWTSWSTRTLAVVTDMHHHTELSFVNEFRWVSPFHYLNSGWQNAVFLWCTLQAKPPFLHCYCAVVFHSCIVLPPVGHPSNYEYHCCQLKRQSSCVSNFYCTLRFSFDCPSYVAKIYEFSNV